MTPTIILFAASTALLICAAESGTKATAGVNKAGDIRLFPSAVIQWLISKQSLITINLISKSVKL